jgi:hypothetical protein
MKRRLLPFLSSLPLFALAATAQAQAFGTGQQLTVIPAAAFRGQSSADLFASTGGVLKPTVDTTTNLVAPVELPNGSVLEEVRLLVADNDPFNDISGYLSAFSQGAASSCACRWLADRRSGGRAPASR